MPSIPGSSGQGVNNAINGILKKAALDDLKKSREDILNRAKKAEEDAIRKQAGLPPTPRPVSYK